MKKYLSLIAVLLLLPTFTADAQKRNKHEVTVAVFAINDFHSNFVRNDNKGLPGAAALWQTLDSLKQVYPCHLTLSAGDNFGGSYFHSATEGVLMPVFFKDMGIVYSALGNHEFDEGQVALQEKWVSSPLRPKDWNLTYVCANVRDTSGAVPAFAQPFATQDIQLGGKKKVRVGIVGLLTGNTPNQTSKSRIKGLTFDENYTAVLDSVKQLPDYKAQVGKADIRLLLTHIGTTMQQGAPAWEDSGAANLKKLNDPTWHAIITGHTHEAVSGTVNDINYPVIQGLCHGRYISVIKFRVNTRKREVTDVQVELCPVRTDLPLKEGPSCLQAQIDSLLRVTKTQGGAALGEYLTKAPETLMHQRTKKYSQTLIGELVCRSYAEAARKGLHLDDSAIVVGVSHFGSIRSAITKGTVSVLDVGEVLPFANHLRVFRVNGKQLRELVNFGFHNRQYGWIQTSWLDICRDADNNVQSLTYTSPYVMDVAITDDTVCYIAADDYMTTGGDGYSPSFFPKTQEVSDKGLPTTTDAFINYLKTLDELPTN